MMLALDDSRWQTLTHAYGSAADIPGLLHDLEVYPLVQSHDYRTEPWFSLWSRVCHQGDIYTASYATVPHLIRIALMIPVPPMDYFLLPTCIEIARGTRDGPPLPPDLAPAYHQAVPQLHAMAYRCASIPWDEGLSRAITAALVVTKGQCRLAHTLLALDPDTLTAFRMAQGFEEAPDEETDG